MVTVSYDAQFSYRYEARVGAVPALVLAMSRPGGSTWVDVTGCIDTGASRSLFDGRLAVTLGFDLFEGRPLSFFANTGARVESRLHLVQLHHDALGRFELEVAFSTTPIGSNLLGRDFMNLVQVGFRENQLTFYVTQKP